MAVPQEWLLIAVLEPRTKRAQNIPTVPSTPNTSGCAALISAMTAPRLSTAGARPVTEKGPTLRVSISGFSRGLAIDRQSEP